MIRLFLLGAPRVVGAPEPGLGRVNQPRSVALLALLAEAGHHGITRDRIAAFLWPDSDESHARRHLSDVLYLVRHELGSAAVTGGTTVLHLENAVITSDLGEFRQAVESGRWEGAVASYGGPFLDGFHVSGASPFEEWVSAKREQLAREFGQALETLAVEAETAADWRMAIEWWRRLLDQDPLSSRVAISLGRAHLAGGDHGTAMSVLETHRRLLHRELGTDTGPVIRRLLDQARSGQALTPAPQVRASPAEDRPGVAPDRSEPGPPAVRARSWLRVAGPLAVVLVLAATGWWVINRDGSALDPNLVAVPPLTVSRYTPALRRVADSVPAMMRAAIQGFSGIDIADPELVARRWRVLHPAGEDALATEQFIDVAKSVGAGLVAVGWITESQGRVWIGVTLIDVPSGRVRVPQAVVEGDVKRLPELLDRLIGEVVERLAAPHSARSRRPDPWARRPADVDGGPCGSGTRTGPMNTRGRLAASDSRACRETVENGSTGPV